MNKTEWIIREIVYFPKFILLCILALLFGIFKYKKGLDKIKKWI